MNRYPVGLVCLSRSWGGLEMNVLRWAGWMSDRGWPVFLICQSASLLAKRASEAGIVVRTVKPLFKYADPGTLWLIRRMIKEHGLRTLIVSQSYEIAAAVPLRSLVSPKPRVVYWQHMQVGRAKQDYTHRFMYRRLDRWVAPLEGLANQAIQLTPIARSQIRVIPFGIELHPFVSLGQAKASYRKLLDIPETGVLLGVVGRLDRQKGQHVAVEALGRLHRQGVEARLLLVGAKTAGEADEYVQMLGAHVEALGLSRYVYFREYVPDPLPVYGALDLFLMTSYSETYGMVTIEAMAAGLPIVATYSGGTPEIITHEKTGLLVQPQDPEALAEAVRRLLTDRELFDRLGQTARTEAKARFSSELQCQQWEQLLAELNTPT